MPHSKDLQPELVEVNPNRIKFTTDNPRRHKGFEFDRLQASIAEIGYVQLPTVRLDTTPGFYVCIDGEGRILAAQNAGDTSIWVVSYGRLDETTAMKMLEAANTVRYFSYLAECKGIANMHRRKMTINMIAKTLGATPSKVTELVSIGYFPNDIYNLIEKDIMDGEGESVRSVSWKTILPMLLVLRQAMPGRTIPGLIKVGGHRENSYQEWFELETLYDYGEVRAAVEAIIRGDICTVKDIRAYVADRRADLAEQRIDKELARRVVQEIEDTRLALETAYRTKLTDAVGQIEQQLNDQVNQLQAQFIDLQHDHRRLLSEASRQPDLIEQQQRDLETRLKAAEQERLRWQRLQKEVDEKAQQKLAREEAALKEKMAQEAAALRAKVDDEAKTQFEQIQQRLRESEHDIAALYEKRDRARQLKTEATMQQAVTHLVELLTQTNQSLLLLSSPGFVKGIQYLQRVEQDVLFAQLDSTLQLLEKAREQFSNVVHATTADGQNVRFLD